MNPSIDLPVGDRPNWEVARAGGYQLKSVADRYVVTRDPILLMNRHRFIQQPNDPAIIASMSVGFLFTPDNFLIVVPSKGKMVIYVHQVLWKATREVN